MKFLNWLLNKKKLSSEEALVNNPDKQSDQIKVYDKYGRELYITREQWKENILIGNLEKAKDNPDKLYNILVGALQDGFFEEGLPYAEMFANIDPVTSRGTAVLGIFYMKCKRLSDAERVLSEFIKLHGDDGVVLTNLAKVYFEQKNSKKAELTLWHSLEVDPNQENGLIWYATMQKENNGDPAFTETFKRVALLPESWRAQLWLARFALEKKDITTARHYYKQSIEKAGKQMPYDLLMQMGGDLGNNGYLKEAIELVNPYFQASQHGLEVGNNLIKANIELGQLDDAKKIITQLYNQKRPDWREALLYWDNEIAQKWISTESQNNKNEQSVVVFSLEGPLWLSNDFVLALLQSHKKAVPPKISIWGNTTVFESVSKNTGLQFVDALGRASRSIPLFLTEQISLSTDAVSNTLIPWVQSKGFAVFGKAYEEKELCEITEKNDVIPDFIINLVINVTDDNLWGITVDIIRRIDRSILETIKTSGQSEDIGPVVLRLTEQVIKSLIKCSDVKEISYPDWYTIPKGVSSSDYLLRLEQLLSVICMNQPSLTGGGLHGEHEIIEGTMFLTLNAPDSKTVRMLLVETLTQMKKYRPHEVELYKEKIVLLQQDHPLDGDEGRLIDQKLLDLF